MNLLDHGYIRFIEAWGTGDFGVPYTNTPNPPDYEVGIIEAARQSTQGSFRGWDTDQKLLQFLYNNKPQHAGPFEFAGMTIQIQAPIFVFREWHRHRTQSYNEMSARDASVIEEKYIPTMDRVMQVNELTKNHQAGNIGGIKLSAENAMKWLEMLEHSYAVAAETYRFGLSVGIAKELARCPMPVGNYSRMRASANLRNWLAFMTLRCDPNAQWEIRCNANAVFEIIQHYFPRTSRLWNEQR